jgi:hypothetical protein
MYNLKTSRALVRTPRLGPNDPPDAKPKNAGPPFEMPYSLNIPDDDIDIWRAHNDLIKTSLEGASDCRAPRPATMMLRARSRRSSIVSALNLTCVR